MLAHTLKIHKQAFLLAKGNKFFWWLGLFLVWFNLAKSLTLLYFLTASMEEVELSRVQFSAAEQGNLWAAAVTLFALLAFTVLYFRSKAFLFWSVKELKDKSRLDTDQVKELAEPHTANLMKMGLGFGIAALLAVLALAGPAMYLAANNYSARAWSSGGLSIAVLLPIMGILYFYSVFAPMFIAIQNLSMPNSLKATFDLIRRRWKLLVNFLFVMVIWDLLAVIATLILSLIAILPFVLLIRIFYDMVGQQGLAILQGLAGIAGFMVFFMSQAWFTSFQRIAWTMLFFEINRPVKASEQAEAVPVPEIAT